MKANELMLGDLVTFKDCLEEGERIMPIKIIELNLYDNSFLAEIDGCEKGCDELEFDDEIVGIPITKELLVRLGFEEQKKKDFWTYDNGKIYVSVGLCGRIVISTPGKKSRNRMNIDCTYVHELQHALQLCGISKEIVL